MMAGALLLAAHRSPAEEAAPDPNEEFALQTWTTEHGMPQDSVTAVLQSGSGYVWVSTYSGIARFDGIRFTVFNPSNARGLANGRITSLFEDHNGVMWVGHDTGDLSKLANGRFQSVPVNARWSGGTIRGIAEDAAEDVWALNARGEALRIRDGLVVKPLAEMTANPATTPQLTVDGRHRLLLARNGIVAEITPTGCQRLDFGVAKPGAYYARVTPAAGGGLWVLGEGRVRKWLGDGWQEDLGEFPWGKSFITAFMETTSGQLLVGTLERGLFIYERKLGWMNLTRSNGLAQDWVRCVTEDREHNIWVGTSGGVVLLRPRKVVMRNPPDGWQGRPVQSITMTRSGAVWAATEGAGLYCLESNTWRHFDASSGLSNLFVWSVLEDSLGRLWAGTWGGGMFRLEGTRFARTFDLAERDEQATALSESPAGTMWIGTTRGLIRCVDDKLERLAPLGGAAAGDVRAIEKGKNGDIWLGTLGQGLGWIQGGKLKTFRRVDGLPSNYILSLYDEGDGKLWIGTLDRGVCLYEKGRFHNISTDQGLPNNVIGDIEEDEVGYLWFSSQQGLFRATKGDLVDYAYRRNPPGALLPVLVFGKAEGMATVAGANGFTPSGFRAPDGRLWFPTLKGIAVVNPKAGRRSHLTPPVWIEEILLDGRDADITTPASEPEAKSPPPARMVELPPGGGQLDILFTGLSFASPERVLFKYRLEGLDKDWIDGGTRRRVAYSFLPPGDYTFRVIACNSDAFWTGNETGDAVRIVVLPQIWQTWWFRVTAGLAGALLVGGAAYVEGRRRNRQRLLHMEHQSELDRERARIAQDIHDDLGASLTRISMLSESATEDLDDQARAAASLGQIYATARDLTRAMDEIVWAVDPHHDTLESLTNYVARFAHDFLSAANIRCRLDPPSGVPEFSVRSEIRHHLFLAFKEILNNAVKHSGATEVRVAFEFQPEGFVLTVADNGAGFDSGELAAAPARDRLVTGYGIAGIRKRVEQIGGRVEIESQRGRGTRVALFIPMRDSVAGNGRPT